MLWAALGILLIEISVLTLHYPAVEAFIIHYVWVAPLLFFKSFIKKFLLLNVFGLLKVLWSLCWHMLKLLAMKLLKTFGVRYGTYLSSQRWRKQSQRVRVLSKAVQRRVRRFQRFMTTLSRHEFLLIVVAFLPLFLFLFLCGVTFRLTREAMVKKGGEIGVSSVVFRTARKSHGLTARLLQVDAWVLRHIERLTPKKP